MRSNRRSRSGSGRWSAWGFAGFTLVEVLAVVALLGLAMSVALVGLGGVLDASAAREAVAIAREVDARARVAARSMGAVAVEPSQEGRVVAVRRGSETILRRELPRGFAVRLVAMDGSPLRSVAIDAAGRSVDHAVEVAGPRGANTLEVAGLTGLLRETGP